MEKRAQSAVATRRVTRLQASSQEAARGEASNDVSREGDSAGGKKVEQSEEPVAIPGLNGGQPSVLAFLRLRDSGPSPWTETEKGDGETTYDDDETEMDDRMSMVSTSLSVVDPFDDLTFSHGTSSTPSRVTRSQSGTNAQASGSMSTLVSSSAFASTSRKRELSFSDDEDTMSVTSSVSMASPTKRPRLKRMSSSSSITFKKRLRNEVTTPTSSRRMPFGRTSSGYLDDPRPFVRGRPRHLSASSSMTDLSMILPPASEQDNIRSEALAMMRTHSRAATRNSSPEPPPLPAGSAHYNLRPSKITIDFSVSYSDMVTLPTLDELDTTPHTTIIRTGILAPEVASTATNRNNFNTVITEACPVSWSYKNVLAFSRGNRVHLRSFAFGEGEDAMQVCKINKVDGDLRILAWAGPEITGTLAAITTRGSVQLWDVNTKTKVQSFHPVNGATCIAWHEHSFVIGQEKGLVRFYDMRTKPASVAKVPKKKLSAQRSTLRSLAWHDEGKVFACGDEAGRVCVWDMRNYEQMNVGDWEGGLHHTRRAQHAGPVKALAWAPWADKLLASADAGETGSTLRVWKINQQVDRNTSSARVDNSSYLSDSIAEALPIKPKSEHPRIEFDAPTTSIHWSPLAKEILTTHGPGHISAEPPPLVNGVPRERPPAVYGNAIAVHSYLTLKRVALASNVAESAIATSAMSPNGQRIVVACPAEKKLKVWDVWKPTLQRSTSKLSFEAKIR